MRAHCAPPGTPPAPRSFPDHATLTPSPVLCMAEEHRAMQEGDKPYSMAVSVSPETPPASWRSPLTHTLLLLPPPLRG